MDQTASNLTGQFLIAMPAMGDPRFDKSVIYMCAHSSEGAMGLIINKQAEGVEFSELLVQLDIAKGKLPPTPVHLGGPVETARGFVLHSDDYTAAPGTMPVANGIGLTATLDILEDMARGEGPARHLVALGYSGWGAGQLEGEIAQNGWLTGPADPEIIFGGDPDGKWTLALKSIGVDPLLLSDIAGHA